MQKSLRVLGAATGAILLPLNMSLPGRAFAATDEANTGSEVEISTTWEADIKEDGGDNFVTSEHTGLTYPAELYFTAGLGNPQTFLDPSRSFGDNVRAEIAYLFWNALGFGEELRKGVPRTLPPVTLRRKRVGELEIPNIPGSQRVPLVRREDEVSGPVVMRDDWDRVFSGEMEEPSHIVGEKEEKKREPITAEQAAQRKALRTWLSGKQRENIPAGLRGAGMTSWQQLKMSSRVRGIDGRNKKNAGPTSAKARHLRGRVDKRTSTAPSSNIRKTTSRYARALKRRS